VLKYTDANGSFPRADEIVDTDALSDVNSPPVNTKPIATCTGGK
jgi:hypothetical protein